MFRVIDYIRYSQPDILECLTRIGFYNLVSDEEYELTPEQRYLDKLMRQRPRPGGVIRK